MATYFKKKNGNTYTVAYRLKGDQRRYVYGIKTEELAKKVERAKAAEEQLSRLGFPHAEPDARRMAIASARTVTVHIDDFEQDILSRGKNAQHAQQQASHCRRLFKMARVNSVGQISCEAFQRALGRLLGPKCGPRTCNAARQAVIQFEFFLKRTGQVSRTVLGDLARFNEKADVRRRGRAMSQEEVDALLSVTELRKDRTSRRCGIDLADRAVLYSVGVGTGFRRRALLSMTKASFFVTADNTRPFVRLSAKFNKNGKPRDQFIRADLAEWLRKWLATRPDSAPVWQPRPHADLSLRFRRDMEAARKAWIRAGPTAEERERRTRSNTLKYVFHDGNQNLFADFHGLRHTGITFVAGSKGIRVAQVWADHSSIAQTTNYAEVDRADL